MADGKGCGILSISLEELARFLALPKGHTIERLTLREFPQSAGLLVTVRGDGMYDHMENAPLHIEPIGRFFEEFAGRMEYRAAKERDRTDG
jgi:hypothetical protein